MNIKLPKLPHPLYQRPIVILVCGERDDIAVPFGELAPIVFHARSRREMEAIVVGGDVEIDVAVVEDLPWLGERGTVVARWIRSHGIGATVAAYTRASAERAAREEVPVDLSAQNNAEQMASAIWLGCWETELLRRDYADFFKSLAIETLPPAPRYVTENGRIEPSKSTVAFMFDGVHAVPAATEGTTPLVAPASPFFRVGEPPHHSNTIPWRPSKSTLRSLRRGLQRHRLRHRRRELTVALIAALIAVAIVIWRIIF